MRMTLAGGGETRPTAHPQWPQLVRALSAPASAEAGLRPHVVRTRGGGRTITRLKIAMRYLRSLGTVGLPRGATYVNVGHSGLERPNLLARMDRSGVRSVVMIHDLIPIVYPEFCGPGAAARHHCRLAASLDHASAILTNSATTADAVRDYATARASRLPPIFVAPLGLEPPFVRASDEPIAALPYFVCVGTLEPRKNLVFLLKIWRRLADQMGPATPRLVLVGRRGWENETVLDHLQRSPPVRKYVHEIADLGDEELARLIGSARALLAPSAAEGFDLPVAEALALSTPVIASDIPAHRELAHGAVLLDPTDGPGWFREIIAAASRPRRRSPPFTPPTWSDHFGIVQQALTVDVEGGFANGADPSPQTWIREG
jgi:glycosyltransferase involved in cell wall biosynthesis